ncbi:hypothetical protein CVT25_002588 [Psilocybe cyanescens]|uniref:SMP-30/Gluconolactonase/LRE-like region domain-containing protein n=1 Tax=Psilocybe cyanescens TaxID=93625 RepID=A0A409WLC6_PSICY|nr:hypothetical protein CVT25_002588 [Psilocybe cyanescens]
MFLPLFLSIGVSGVFATPPSIFERALNASLQTNLPAQAVLVDPKSFAVLGPNGPFRNSSFSQLFNPTSTAPPFFQIFDPAFLDILGPNASFNIISTNKSDSILFYSHEAPVYLRDTDELFFAGLDLSKDVVNKISMKAVENALEETSGTVVNVPATPITLPSSVQHVNGGTGPLGSSLVLVTDGFGSLPPSVVLVNPQAPYNATVLLDNFYGRQFNSMNDVKIHPTSKAIFFTDVSIGNIITIRPPPLMPNQVYRLDPNTRAVQVVATDFDLCNGIAFSADGKYAYVYVYPSRCPQFRRSSLQTAFHLHFIKFSTDSGAVTSISDVDQTRPATIYQFDVSPTSQIFTNRRIFAYADTGVPDGITLDAAGNVYAGCGDGVHIWSPTGALLGKFFTGDVVANMQFAGDGRLVLLGGANVYMARIAAREGSVAFP